MSATVREHARLAAQRLDAAGVPDARLDAELLLAAVLGTTRAELLLDRDRRLSDDERARYDGFVARRAGREPLQYIVGRTSFREIELRTDARALIPRPETEVLVGVVMEWTRAHRRRDLRALDVGTGTGAIALSLLAEGGVARAVATDASDDALALARENAEALGLIDRLELRRGATWEPVASGERFDVVVSNPPYVAAGEAASLQPEVVRWEPHAALFAGGDGLDVVEPIVRGAAERLARPGLLALELAPGQADAVAGLARVSGLARVRIIHDLAGRARIVAGETA